ncbi:hypothetical protein B0H13DRAFT_1904526 [Mycena leptocephala]|nr:hypothetical protein B0H13DRAFT_1904526 [Mycena leptocephala]
MCQILRARHASVPGRLGISYPGCARELRACTSNAHLQTPRIPRPSASSRMRLPRPDLHPTAPTPADTSILRCASSHRHARKEWERDVPASISRLLTLARRRLSLLLSLGPHPPRALSRPEATRPQARVIPDPALWTKIVCTAGAIAQTSTRARHPAPASIASTSAPSTHLHRARIHPHSHWVRCLCDLQLQVQRRSTSIYVHPRSPASTVTRTPACGVSSHAHAHIHLIHPARAPSTPASRPYVPKLHASRLYHTHSPRRPRDLRLQRRSAACIRIRASAAQDTSSRHIGPAPASMRHTQSALVGSTSTPRCAPQAVLDTLWDGSRTPCAAHLYALHTSPYLLLPQMKLEGKRRRDTDRT